MKHLYTPDDVRKIRENILKKQDNACAVTGYELDPKETVCDHTHDRSQLVRGVLHRQTNVYLGKLENNYVRMMAWWYDGTLPNLLRDIADYLEKEPYPIIHPGWLKKSKTAFNKLNSKAQEDVLKEFFVAGPWKNTEARKKAFDKLIKSKTITYAEILESIEYAAIRRRK